MAMDDSNFTETIRKIFLAGVGAIATSAEKSKDLIDKLVEKGELTTQQGKILNQELKHKINDTTDDLRTRAANVIAPKKTEPAEEDSSSESGARISDEELTDLVDSLSPEQLKTLRVQLDARSAVDDQ
uniref:phasin family protein n=1 Tax=Eubacterium cellulosolvens TaxID=29322 RepID=UPI00068549B1|nr:phasin family protein [[Eubacterium] cellulosolvens]